MRDDKGKSNRPVRPVRTYASLDAAYKHFNRHLFGGLLGPCMITLQRHKGAFGYFVAARMAELDDGEDQAVDEIALNPAAFEGRSPKDILSTLVHEMVHLWQQHYGKPTRNRYHNAEWAAKMKAVGLVPSHTGRPGGRETGQKMSHYIEEGGPYARAYARLESPRVLYRDVHDAGESATRRKKAASKTKYTCPGCEANAWAKPGMNLVCGDCSEAMIAQDLEPDDAQDGDA
jgi:predicted SprT family Zn-dependent metalloprotease